MKKIVYTFLLLFICQSCCTDGTCNDDNVDTLSIVSNYEPVVLDRTTFENSLTLSEPKTIVNSGKIYVIADLLFVNEKNEGFHIIDNEDPSNPTQLAFIEAPGATDLAIKNNVYYINQAVDLVAVTYTKQGNMLEITKRIRNVFPVKTSPDGYLPVTPEDAVIVNYILRN